MEIKIDIDLNGDEEEQLAQILGCDAEDLEDNLVPFFEAASEEHIKMYLGQRVFTRGSDFKEYRLFLLINHAFDGIPSEQEISNLFQTTITQSRSLVRSVMSKYQYELSNIIKETLSEVINEAEQIDDDDSGKYYVTIGNKSIVEAINLKLSSIDGTLPQIKKKRNSVNNYEIKPSSYNKLVEYFEE